MLPLVQELIVVEGSHDERTIKQTVQATVLVVGGWGAKRDEITRFLKKAETTGKGILLFLDSDETGTQLESYLLSVLSYPKKAKVALLEEKLSSAHGKVGLEHAKPKDVLKALERAGATFLSKAPRNLLSEQDLLELRLKNTAEAPSRRALIEEVFHLSKGNAKHLLDQLNFLGIQREELASILDKKDPV